LLQEQLKKLAEKLAKTTDPAERQKLLQELAERLAGATELSGSELKRMLEGAGLKPGMKIPGQGQQAGGGKPGQDSGPGMGGPGRGQGGKAPEDPTAKSDFTPEQAKSALTAGKMLLKWKARGVADAGKATEEYLRNIEKVKQGVSEAVLHEQVPPGYHEIIKKYFDTMGGMKKNKKPTNKGEEDGEKPSK
jgi:hypothetical protein